MITIWVVIQFISECISYIRPFYSLTVSPDRKPTTISHKDDEEDSEISVLLITSQQSVDKETLQMYVEQFAEHFEMRKHENNSWTLKLYNQSDLQKILAQKEHEFGISLKVYKEGHLGQVDPHRFILTGFDGNTDCKIISVFIGSCSKTTEHTWEILDEDRIVVTFKRDIASRTTTFHLIKSYEYLITFLINPNRLWF
ncbi:uncharacterized protein LOC127448283 isoform X2 [Myxocyprinus asiaticus]|uniref:uncharacterized protein LOC127448283 isoform X2 n=1 Tax=Myxocyprinus asiaticus TaxID=70543 RepID=UPI002222CC87|nr:uncharacterized protein LOC127448283 isoform X2 [Myxocyprinus asiaticus]